MDPYDRYRWNSGVDARQVKRVNELPGYEAALNAVVQLVAEYVVEFLGPRWVDEINARAKGELARQDLPLAMSVKQAADTLGISRAKVYEGVRAGQIPSIHLGSRISIPTHKLIELLDGNASGS